MAIANVAVTTLSDGRQVCLSYGVPVAVFIPGRGYLRTDKRYSVTSSRHASNFAPDAEVIPHRDFIVLIRPIVTPDAERVEHDRVKRTRRRSRGAR